MTPAKRRKLLRSFLVLITVMLAGIASRFYFLNQSIPSLIMGRKPGSADPGTVLVRPVKASKQDLSPPQITLPPEAHSPVKLKFDTLGGWKFIEGKTPIPAEVKKFEGKWVEVSGFMMPINETEHISRFIVVQSLWGCCFGQTPAVNHIIMVHMEPGKTIDFYPDPVKIIGKFSVGETREEGYLVSIYNLEATSVVVK